MIRFSDAAENTQKTECLEKHADITPAKKMTDQDAEIFWKTEFQKVHDEIALDDYDALLSEVFDRYEDEIDIDFNIDDTLSSILERFNPGNWDELGESERETAILELVNCLGDRLGLDDIPVVDYYDGDLGEHGYFDPLDKSIGINKLYFDNPIELVNTIAHETRHAYQHERADICDTHEDTLYRVNFDNYISPIFCDGECLFFMDYYNQYVEVDARAFANIITEAMKNES